MPAVRAVAPRWRAHWPVAALTVVAMLLALWARHRLFPAYSWNRDEPVYLWHVDVLRSGRLTAPDGGHPSLFQPWLSARGDGELFTQYTLGWPLVLLAGQLLTGAAGAALLLGAGLAVVGTYAFGMEVLRDQRVATLGAGLMVASPILPIQGGAYLSYLFTLGLGLVAGVLLLSGIRRDSRLRLTVAGLLLGWIFLTRPYDALLWGVAFACIALLRARDRWAASAARVGLTAAAALPLVGLALAYNRRVTGSWLQFPITAADPMDTFGFGPKRLMPTFEIIDYDPASAIRATAKNAFLLPWFLAGTYVGLLLAVVQLWRRRRAESSLALLLVAAVFPIGYFVFWGNHLSSLAARISGPIYFIPLYAPICLLMASALAELWRHRRRLALLLGVAIVAATVPASLSRFDVNRDVSLEQEAWRASVADLRGRALVFVADSAPYLLYLNPFSSNDPDLDGRILYATDGDPAMLDLIAEMPDRTPYLQQANVPSPETGPREDPLDLTVSLQPVEVRTGAALQLDVTVPRLADARLAHVTIATGVATHTIDVPLRATDAPAAVDVVLVPPGTATGLELADRGAVSILIGYGDTARDASRSPELETQLVYRVLDGRIETLLPAAESRRVVVDGELQWRRTRSGAGAGVEVTPAALPR